MLRLHHTGIVVANIAESAARYADTFGYEVKSEVIHDPVQTAYVQFLRLPGDEAFLELVTPDGEKSKLSNALRKGGGLNHLCYATDDLDAACRDLRRRGLFLLQAPVSAAAFPGRRIAWLMAGDRVPVELVEAGPRGGL